MKCKTGDLAIIIKDFPGCEKNLGRIVEIHGPCPDYPSKYRLCWFIVSKDGGPLAVLEKNGTITYQFALSEASKIVHPDNWLLPLANSNEDSEVRDISETADIF